MADAQTRFDQDVDAAWREFRTRLADHVAAMCDGDGLVLEPFTDEAGGPAGPCVQFYAWGDRLVRCEVPSNAHLAPDRHLTPVDEQMLLELGLQAPSRGPDDPEDGGSPAFWIDRPGSWADQLAVIAVRALRSVWGVPHPLFLRAETFGTERSVTELTSFLVPETPQADRTQAPEVPLAVVPTGDDHVRELIESTLHERIDDLPPGTRTAISSCGSPECWCSSVSAPEAAPSTCSHRSSIPSPDARGPPRSASTSTAGGRT